MKTEKQKGQPGEELPFFPPPGEERSAIARPGLRQVIAEGGEDHVVDGLRLDAPRPRPAALRDVGVLETPANSTLRALVHLMPEAQGAFLDKADVPCAGAGPRC